MGQVIFSRPGQTELRALGLGSCIGLCLYDPLTKMGCLAHIVLPESNSRGNGDLGKYADTAVPFCIDQMVSRGAIKSRIKVAMAGGAQLFNFQGSDQRLDVGRRNTEAVKKLLAESKLRVVAEDVGGKQGRTLIFDASTGRINVRKVGGEEQRLADLN